MEKGCLNFKYLNNYVSVYFLFFKFLVERVELFDKFESEIAFNLFFVEEGRDSVKFDRFKFSRFKFGRFKFFKFFKFFKERKFRSFLVKKRDKSKEKKEAVE